jgi:prophage regulatory protein
MNDRHTTTALIRASELVALVPYSLNHIRRLEYEGAFPKRVRLGANRVGWVLAEVQQWLKDRMKDR